MNLDAILPGLTSLVEYLAAAYARATFTEIAIAFVIVVALNVAGYFVGRALGWPEIDELHRSWAALRANFKRPKED